jgi:hypothetical protein
MKPLHNFSVGAAFFHALQQFIAHIEVRLATLAEFFQLPGCVLAVAVSILREDEINAGHHAVSLCQFLQMLFVAGSFRLSPTSALRRTFRRFQMVRAVQWGKHAGGSRRDNRLIHLIMRVAGGRPMERFAVRLR